MRQTRVSQVFTCDKCYKEASSFIQDTRFLPIGWIRVTWGGRAKKEEHDRHFCSLSCLSEWVLWWKKHTTPASAEKIEAALKTRLGVKDGE